MSVIDEKKLPLTGSISWYGPGFDGRKTANGETFDQDALTAAAIGLPFGFKLKVTNLSNQKSVMVRINDRGPYQKVKGKFEPHPGRLIDVSKGAAEQLDMIKAGIISAKIEKAS
jgi:rare lipoprotein A